MDPDVILLRPLWLLGLFPLAVMAIARRHNPGDAGGWERVMPKAMLQAMIALGAIHTRQSRLQGLSMPLAILALLCGLSGPAIPRGDTPVLAQSDAALIAIDMSASVATGPDLKVAQLAAAGVLQGLAGRPVGLIVYTGEAYLAAAPTTDPATLETLLAVLDADTVPGRGSQPAAALAMAATMFRQVPQGDLILISDGGGVDPATNAAADRLAAQSVRISALRLVNPAPGASPPPGDALDRLTRNDGMVLPAGDSTRLAAALSTGPSVHRAADLTALQYRDLGPFLAALALIPLMLLLRRPL
ncbi:VWA domain-containing protein [Paracoccus sp. Z330]|uniref:VWA domain-containing protein n=1 Tax=Paracoccus onchidii TaxID=3017813 RepID=A0ABT4ZCW3_9RHOB|nr:VWA domain-containing protein [Paracoccus onchidii]MDB6177204.1 VWA domain-containing protein [Paracoccus onchidii]